MIAELANTRARSAFPFSTVALAALLVLGTPADPASQTQTTTFTLYSPDARRSVVVRTGSTPEMIALDQLAGTFGLTLTEDRAANGLVITTKGERIYAFPGQNFVRAAGRVVVLDGPVQRDRNAWMVPIDFLAKALGPSIGQPIVVRRPSRLILVGNVRVPEIGGRVERTANGARVIIAIRPPTPYRVTRDGNRLTIRFDANGLDTSPLTGFIPEFATAARVDGLNLVIDLGPSAASYRVEDDRASSTLTIDLSPPLPPPLPTPRTPPPVPMPPPGSAGALGPPPPAAPIGPPAASTGQPPNAPPGSLRTIVIDAGHGGSDTGAVGAGGAKEKDLTLQIARRLKAAIEGRLGLRVLLTRDGDDDVTVDRRSELANNNKADVFLSLHFNYSVRAAAHGAQVYTLGLDQYHDQLAQADAQRRPVPVVGGGSRVIEPVPWDLAQLPFAEQSAWLGSVIARVFAERNVPMFSRPAVQSPMRVLMGAHMPAVLIELGFLSNAEDERAFAAAEWQSAVVESLLATLSELRRGEPGRR